MERLIKNEILLRLDFSDADKCVDCMKNAKTIKKGVVRAMGVLEQGVLAMYVKITLREKVLDAGPRASPLA
jgi:hypothetical protein